MTNKYVAHVLTEGELSRSVTADASFFLTIIIMKTPVCV